jgi:uncharacterized protein (DUF2141 family)
MIGAVRTPRRLQRSGQRPADKRRHLVAFVVLLVVLLSVSFLQQEAAVTHTLTITAIGVSNSKGVIGALVFTSSEGWPENPSASFRSRAVPAQSDITELTFSTLPDGTYAVVVLHDENQNMKLDRNWIGMPKEQWGMSENPHAFLSAPKFDEAKFSLSSDLHLQISLH